CAMASRWPPRWRSRWNSAWASARRSPPGRPRVPVRATGRRRRPVIEPSHRRRPGVIARCQPDPDPRGQAKAMPTICEAPAITRIPFGTPAPDAPLDPASALVRLARITREGAQADLARQALGKAHRCWQPLAEVYLV